MKSISEIKFKSSLFLTYPSFYNKKLFKILCLLPYKINYLIFLNNVKNNYLNQVHILTIV